ncbi:MAG: family 20 glycosylhydrolase [Acidobacteria bacterium]|nr:family 20 glycosylhydrolase [Candidatus Sulfomarinibacter kjeldsenii]
MKNVPFVICLVLSIQVAAAEGPPTLNLMPVPAQLELGDASIKIGPEFSVTIEGEGGTPRLHGGVGRMLRRLSDRSALFFDNSTFLQLKGRSMAAMVVTAGRAGELALGEDESYRLTITSDGIALQAATDIGALRGLETFLQLLTLDENGVTVPEIAIFDQPRFPWRGLMIDSSRHFMPVEMVKRNLDGMAAVKLNVLHWHLVDDQGFRVETLAWPKLHELASDGNYYTRAQIRDIIDYAAERGIRVVPEFDLPGHGSAWLTAYPELASAPGPYEIERSWGIFDPTINPTIEKTYEFLDALMAEMAELFDDEFIHIGGDENNGKHWLANPEIVAFMDEKGYEGPLTLQRYFNERVLAILTKYGKRMIGWDEIFEEGLPKNVVIQSWRGRESLFESARLGYSGILSNGYYIDLIHPTDDHYLNDPLPADSPLTPEEAARILGGEATMWAEYVSPETVDSRIWPRTAAIAERFWSPSRVRDLEDMYRRMDRISLMLEELGLQHERNRPMMLRRLCQCRDVAALEVLLGAIEPVKVYNRGRLRKHTQFSPLTRMVDAAWPDAGPARDFRWAVERLIESDFMDEEDLGAVESTLIAWRDNRGALEETLRTSPALADIEPMSSALAEASAIGLEALVLATTDSSANKDWLDLRLERLNAARKSHGQVELVMIDPVVDLVCAVTLPVSMTAEGCREQETPVVEHH